MTDRENLVGPGRVADLTPDDYGAIAWFENGGMSRIDPDVLAKFLNDLAVRDANTAEAVS